MRVLAFGASNAVPSINQQFALWAAQQIPDADIETLDLNDFELPLYSTAREAKMGTPPQVQRFLQAIEAADVVIIGFAEHNGSYTAAWKNFSDWVSRARRDFLQQKPVLVLATSPGGGGARSVLTQAQTSLPHFGAQVLDAVSLPKFGEHFDVVHGQLRHAPTRARIYTALETLLESA